MRYPFMNSFWTMFCAVGRFGASHRKPWRYITLGGSFSHASCLGLSIGIYWWRGIILAYIILYLALDMGKCQTISNWCDHLGSDCRMVIKSDPQNIRCLKIFEQRSYGGQLRMPLSDLSLRFCRICSLHWIGSLVPHPLHQILNENDNDRRRHDAIPKYVVDADHHEDYASAQRAATERSNDRACRSHAPRFASDAPTDEGMPSGRNHVMNSFYVLWKHRPNLFEHRVKRCDKMQ